MEAVDCLEDSSGRDNIKPRGDGTGDLAHPAYYAGSGFDADGPRYYTQTGAMSARLLLFHSGSVGGLPF